VSQQFFPDRDLWMPLPSRHRWRCLVLSLLALTGCTRWRTEPVSPVELLALQPPLRIRITRVDRSRVELHRPQLVGDTIIDGRTRRGIPTQVSLDEVASVAVRKWDPFGTAGVLIGTAALGTALTIGLMWDGRAD
jgi:hypothetical protein